MNEFQTFDRLNKTNTYRAYRFKQRLFEHQNQMRVFLKTINEQDQSKRDLVLKHLSNNDLDTIPGDFLLSLQQSNHPDMLTPYTKSELSNMRLFKVPGMNIGYALKRVENGGYSELVAVHNNEPDVSNIGKDIVDSAVRNGACYLDHFDGFLSNLYQSMGFEEYKRDPYDPQYDPEGKFRSKYGQPDIIYRKHRNCNQ